MSQLGNTRRRRCQRCGKLTTKWECWNGGSVNCFDGCFSTTGSDHRTIDGQPAWLPHEGKAAWDKSRLWSEYWKTMEAKSAKTKPVKSPVKQ